MANARFYSSTAEPTTLSAGINNSTTSITVVSSAGFPGSFPFTLALDFGSAGEELVSVLSGGPTMYTVTRGFDGTSATSHGTGAQVRHVTSAIDFTELQTHIAATSDVHGVTGVGNDLVGTQSTQTLSNKTLDDATGTLVRVDLYNTGNWVTSVIGDSANPNFSRLQVLDNEVSLNQMWAVLSNGAMYSKRQTADTDGTYRLRITDTNGTTDRFAVLAGGTATISPDSDTTSVALDIVAPDTSTSKRALRVAASGGGSERLSVWNDGRVDITGTNTGFSVFDVTGPLAQAAAYTRTMDGSGNVLHTIGSTAKTTAAGTMDVRNDFHTDGGAEPVLRVFGKQPGQTADLQQWVDSSNTIVATMDEDGRFDSALTTPSGSITAASGFSIVTSNLKIKNGVVYALVVFERTGSTITADSAGSIGDVDAFTLPTAARPNSTFGAQTLPFDVNDGFGGGWGRISTAGVFELVAWVSNGTIQSGRNIRVFMTYPAP